MTNSMIWENDAEFVAWLDQEGLGTDDNPLDEDTLDLMHRAWTAAAQHKFNSKVNVWRL